MTLAKSSPSFKSPHSNMPRKYEHTYGRINNVPVRTVHASRGKIIRAEPVSALYEQHRISHVGCFPELEDQLCSFEPGSTDSPDRLDSLVYAFTDLMVRNAQPVQLFA
jgi:phage terminase large subunit-like protein